MSERITELNEDDFIIDDGQMKTSDLNFRQNSLTGNQALAHRQQGVLEAQNNLVGDTSEKVLNATTNLLNAAKFEPPKEFWKDPERAPETDGFWSTLKALPQQVLISVGFAIMSFLSLLAYQLGGQFVWGILGCGVITVLYIGIEKLSRAHEVSVTSQIRAGQVSLIATVSSRTQETAMQLKQQTHQMHKATLDAVRDVENMRSKIAQAEMNCHNQIASLNAEKDVKIKEITEDSLTTRTKLQNDNAIQIAGIEANTTTQIEKGKQSLEQQKITSSEKIDVKKLQDAKDKHASEEETKRKIAELEKQNETKRIQNEADLKKKQVEADLNKHELKLRNETEQKKIELEGAAKKVEKDFAYKVRLEEERTKRIQTLNSTGGSFRYSWSNGNISSD